MRHRASFRKLNMRPKHRKAMFRNMVTSLFQHEVIETTIAKAKELRRFADRMITYGKRQDHFGRVKILSYVRTEEVSRKVWNDLAERFRDRHGGYVRVLRTRNRRGDNAQMAVVELVDTPKTILTESQLRYRQIRKPQYKPSLTDALPERSQPGRIAA